MEEAAPCTGAVLRMSSEDSHRLCITGMSLLDPAVVHGEHVVNVWAEVGHETRAIGTLSSKNPVVSVPPVVLGGEFVLRHDLAVASAVELNVRVLGAPASSADDVEEALAETVLVLGEDEDEAESEEEDVPDEAAAAAGVEYEPLSEEDMAERYDSDNERSRTKNNAPLVAAPAGSVVPDGEFLGPATFATVGNTTGFMRIAASEANGDQESKEIVVLYRYTRFSRPRSGRRGVEPCRRTKLHFLRFTVPPAGDLATSLAWAGSSLGPLIYPGLFRRQLQELWTSMAAPAIGTIPRGARLQVIVHAGILRREDYSAERMSQMHGSLSTGLLDAWPAHYHVVRELYLPEPVPANGRTIGDEEEEDCCVCFELLESGMAAWPGCGHVFHGACVEKTLARSEMCPLCRHRLSDPLVQKNTKMHP